REDDSGIPAQDLRFRIPEEPLRARVPGGDTAVTISREDGEFRRALDEEAEPLLALADPRLGLHLGRPVAEDLDEPPRLIGPVSQRHQDTVGPESAAALPHVPTLVLGTACA